MPSLHWRTCPVSVLLSRRWFNPLKTGRRNRTGKSDRSTGPEHPGRRKSLDSRRRRNSIARSGGHVMSRNFAGLRSAPTCPVVASPPTEREAIDTFQRYRQKCQTADSSDSQLFPQPPSLVGFQAWRTTPSRLTAHVLLATEMRCHCDAGPHLALLEVKPVGSVCQRYAIPDAIYCVLSQRMLS